MRQDLPLAVLVRSFAGVLIFHILSEAVAFSDGVPRVELPVSFGDQVDWVGGRVEIYLHGVLGGERP